MAKRVISVLLAAVLLLSLLTACGKDETLTLEDAKTLVCQDLNIKQSDASSIDVHLTTVGSAACYLVYVSVNGQHWQYTVNSLNGEILEKEETDHGHSH